MTDRFTRRLTQVEVRVEELARAVEELADRLAAVEGLRSGAVETVEDAPEPRADAAVAPADLPVSEGTEERWGPVPLLGRTLMVLGGAYLFRALTEGGAVPPALGVALGLTYALVWLVLADRAAARERHLSASFHGAAFALIAPPLAWEAAARFQVLSAVQGAALLAALAGAALAIAWRRDLRSVAWLASVATALSAWAFMGSLEPVLPGAFVLVLLAVADDWAARDRGWLVLPWLTALAADLTLAFMLLGELLGEPASGRGGAVAGLVSLLVTLFVLWTGSAAARAARKGWRPRWLELFQLPVAAVLGYGGAFVLVWRLAGPVPEAVGAPIPAGLLTWLLGLASLGGGLASLAAMRAVFPRRAERRPAYHLFAWTGILLILGGTALLLPEPALAGVWSLLAVAAAWLSARRGSVTLGLHAGVLGLGSAVASGLLLHAGYALAASAGRPWPELRPSALAALAALAVAASLELPAESPFWGRAGARLPKLVLLAVLAWGGFGALAAGLGRAVVGEPGAVDPEAAGPALALLRMVVIAAAALLLAALGRVRRYREAAWLVYPVLVAGGFKLILEDFLLGRAAELFAALGIYGAVLILAPRMARAGRRPGPEGAP